MITKGIEKKRIYIFLVNVNECTTHVRTCLFPSKKIVKCVIHAAVCSFAIFRSRLKNIRSGARHRRAEEICARKGIRKISSKV